MTAPDSPLLSLRGLQARYGASQVLHGVDLDVGRAEIVALLGRNGAGRSTTLKAIMGLMPDAASVSGSIRFQGREIAGLAPHRIARLGIGYVPENRDIFPALSVRENLQLGIKPGSTQPQRWGFEDTWRTFPPLRERADAPGGALSGGEQQMLSLCRALMGDPDLLLVDEPAEGLAPAMVRTVAKLLTDIAARGVAVLLVEQKLSMALAISHRVCVMGHGRDQFTGTPLQLSARDDLRRQWLEA